MSALLIALNADERRQLARLARLRFGGAAERQLSELAARLLAGALEDALSLAERINRAQRAHASTD